MPGVPFISTPIAAAFPSARLIVEVAWGADLTATPATWTWTDETTNVRYSQKIRIVPGRGDESSQAQPASCTFQLDNTTGNYSPYNPTSIRYPNVRRNTPVRVSVDLGTGGGPKVRFFGSVNGFTPSWDITAKLAVVSVSASGILRRLQQGKSPLQSPVSRTILNAGPIAYWSLEDGSTATQAGSALTGGFPLTTINTVKFGQIDTPSGTKAPEIVNGRLTGICPTGVSTTGFSVHFAARMTRIDPTLSADVWPLSVQTTDGRVWTWNISQNNGPVAATALVGEQAPPLAPTDPGTEVRAPTGFTPFDGQWHSYLMVATKVSSTTVQLDAYFDGRACQGTTVNGAVTFKPLGGSIRIPEETWATNSRVASLSVDHVAMFDYSLGQATAEQLSATVLGWAGEKALARLSRLCSEQSVPFPSTTPVTLVSEGFETGSPAITIAGTWARDSSQFHSGAWSYKSATITHNGTTDAVVTVPTGATSMTVWYKVSSETGFDYFRILRDDAEVLRSSGDIPWTQRTINVTGISYVTFRYAKDTATTVGLDAAWIDDVVFIQNNDVLASLNTAPMGPQLADTFINLVRECETADAGVLYDGFSNGLAYITNASRYNQAASLTVDVATGQVGDPFEPIDDDQRNRNLAKVDRKNGSTATYEDKLGPLGTAAIGTYDTSLTVNTQTDGVLLDRASWEVHKGTVEGLRYPSLKLDFVANPGLLPAWLAATLNKRIDVTNITSKATQHPPGDVSLLLEGYTETLAPDEWSVKPANCSPSDPYRVFKLEDTALGRLDTAGSNLVTGVSAAATSLSVATTSGPLWITTATFPAQFPFDAIVGGWKVTVTAISGTSSPQTFTVNAVPAAIPINAVVKLWKPGVWAL